MVTPDNITGLKLNEVFVFGSNEAGQHGGGAARVAHEKFGAVMGIGEGLVGQSYAYPTLNEFLHERLIMELQESADTFIKTAEALPGVTFYLTKVGCGIAGRSEDFMKQFFEKTPDNVIKPKGW